jgi:hypothetical protein
MRASQAAEIASQLGWFGDRVSIRCEGVLISTWVVVNEDEHRRRGDSGAVASIQELHRQIDIDAGGSWAAPLEIVGVACGPEPWRAAASAVGRYVTVAPRAVMLSGDDAEDDIVRSEARMWGIGLIIGDHVVEQPAPAEVESGTYQRWLAEECYGAWLKGSPMPRSVA